MLNKFAILSPITLPWSKKQKQNSCKRKKNCHGLNSETCHANYNKIAMV